MNTDELRTVAEAATPGPWESRHLAAYEEARVFAAGAVMAMLDGRRLLNEKANAAFIAAFDPPTVLALLDALEAAEGRAEEAEQQTALLMKALPEVIFATLSKMHSRWADGGENSPEQIAVEVNDALAAWLGAQEWPLYGAKEYAAAEADRDRERVEKQWPL